MAITVATATLPEFKVSVPTEGRLRTAVVQWTLSGTYATGGFSYAGNEAALFLGIKIPVFLEFPGLFRNGTNAVIATWDRTNKKVMWFWSTTGAGIALPEVANTTSLASYVGLVKVTGY